MPKDTSFSFGAEVKLTKNAAGDLIREIISGPIEEFSKALFDYEVPAKITSQDGAVCPYCAGVTDPPQGDPDWFEAEPFEIDCHLCGESFEVTPVPPSGEWSWETREVAAGGDKP